MANQGLIAPHFQSTTAINLKTTGATLIVPAVSGKKFIPISVRLYGSAMTGANTNATGSLGNNSTSYNNLCASQSIVTSPIDGTLFIASLTLINSGTTFTPVLDIGSTGIYLNITVGATGTTCQGYILIEGLIV